MKYRWHADELLLHWTPTPEEQLLIRQKNPLLQLGFAVLLKYFQYQGRFPLKARDVPAGVIDHIAKQLKLDSLTWQSYDWSGRTIKYHRAEMGSSAQRYVTHHRILLNLSHSWLVGIIATPETRPVSNYQFQGQDSDSKLSKVFKTVRLRTGLKRVSVN